MNAPHHAGVLPGLGEPFEGGFYAGKINIDGAVFALIVAPRETQTEAAWNKATKAVAGATSFCDGLANTRAMAAAGSALAKEILKLDAGGMTDWYLPSRDELEMLYRAFKPTDDENFCWRGDNPSSIPVGYAYSPAFPARTAVSAFREESEAFARSWYWSSSQYAGYEAFAWAQNFGYGNQYNCRKDDELRARAVRRLPL